MSKLRNQKVVLFRHGVQRVKGTKSKPPTRIDDAVNVKDVANLWKIKCYSVLNEVDDSKCKKDFMSKNLLTNRGVIVTVSPEEVCMYANGLYEN